MLSYLVNEVELNLSREIVDVFAYIPSACERVTFQNIINECFKS